MRSVRSNCFETNSSSTHSLTLATSGDKKTDVAGVIVVGDRGFGWEYEKFNDFTTKCDYLWILANSSRYDIPSDYQYPELRKNLIALSRKYEFLLADEPEGHIDHGGEHYYDSVQKDPRLSTLEGLEEFLFNPKSWLFLGNDNECSPPGFYLTPEELLSKPYFVAVDNQYAPIDRVDDNEIENALHLMPELIGGIGNRALYLYSRISNITPDEFDIIWYKYDQCIQREISTKTHKYRVITNEQYKNEIATQVS